LKKIRLSHHWDSSVSCGDRDYAKSFAELSLGAGQELCPTHDRNP